MSELSEAVAQTPRQMLLDLQQVVKDSTLQVHEHLESITRRMEAIERRVLGDRATQQVERVLIFIDHTNFRLLVRQMPNIDYGKLRDFLVGSRVEIDTRLYYSEREMGSLSDTERSQRASRERFYGRLRALGFALIELPRVQRGDRDQEKCLDAEIVADMIDAGKHPRIDTIILVAGDADYHRVVWRLRMAYTRVEVAFFRQQTSIDLIRAASRFIDLSENMHRLRREGEEG